MAFEVGDKIKCILPGLNNLTEGNVYKVIKAEFENAVHIVDDLGNMVHIFVERFVLFNEQKAASNFKAGDKVYINYHLYEKDNIYTLKEDYADRYPNCGYSPGEWFKLEEIISGVKSEWMTLVEKAPEIKEEKVTKPKSKSSWGF